MRMISGGLYIIFALTNIAEGRERFSTGYQSQNPVSRQEFFNRTHPFIFHRLNQGAETLIGFTNGVVHRFFTYRIRQGRQKILHEKECFPVPFVREILVNSIEELDAGLPSIAYPVFLNFVPERTAPLGTKSRNNVPHHTFHTIVRIERSGARSAKDQQHKFPAAVSPNQAKIGRIDDFPRYEDTFASVELQLFHSGLHSPTCRQKDVPG